jgi:hypothetical protein
MSSRIQQMRIVHAVFVVLLCATMAEAQGRAGGAATQGRAGAAGARGRAGGAAKPSRPVPRWPDGTVNLGAPPGESGVWNGIEPLTTDPDNYEKVSNGRERKGEIHIDDVPMQPWARALVQAREKRFLADEPYTRCKPSPAARSFGAAYGVELLNSPGSDTIYLFMIGGPHTYRTIHMGQREHPANVTPSDLGHSVGWWEGDTLVIDTIGYNESAWMERFAMPHTDKLHTIERVTRRDFNTLDYKITVDDPGAYTAPWTSGYVKTWESGTDLFEYVCQENNFGPQLMIAVEGADPRGTPVYIP